MKQRKLTLQIESPMNFTAVLFGVCGLFALSTLTRAEAQPLRAAVVVKGAPDHSVLQVAVASALRAHRRDVIPHDTVASAVAFSGNALAESDDDALHGLVAQLGADELFFVELRPNGAYQLFRIRHVARSTVSTVFGQSTEEELVIDVLRKIGELATAHDAPPQDLPTNPHQAAPTPPPPPSNPSSSPPMPLPAPPSLLPDPHHSELEIVLNNRGNEEICRVQIDGVDDNILTSPIPAQGSVYVNVPRGDFRFRMFACNRREVASRHHATASGELQFTYASYRTYPLMLHMGVEISAIAHLNDGVDYFAMAIAPFVQAQYSFSHRSHFGLGALVRLGAMFGAGGQSNFHGTFVGGLALGRGGLIYTGVTYLGPNRAPVFGIRGMLFSVGRRFSLGSDVMLVFLGNGEGRALLMETNVSFRINF